MILLMVVVVLFFMVIGMIVLAFGLVGVVLRVLRSTDSKPLILLLVLSLAV